MNEKLSARCLLDIRTLKRTMGTIGNVRNARHIGHNWHDFCGAAFKGMKGTFNHFVTPETCADSQPFFEICSVLTAHSLVPLSFNVQNN